MTAPPASDRRPQAIWRRARIALLSGATLVLVSLPWYVSHDRRVVLDVWSEAFAAAVAGLGCLWLVVLWYGWRRWRRGAEAGAGATAFDLAVLCWGAAYLVSTLDDRTNAARLLDVNLLGSVAPVAVMLEWMALVLLCVAAGLWLGPRLPQWGHNAALALGAVLALGLVLEGAVRAKAVVAPAVASFPTNSLKMWLRRCVNDRFVNDIGYLSAEFGFRPLTVRNVISESPRSLRDRVHPLRVVYWNSYAFQEVHSRLKVLGWGRPRGGGGPSRLAAYQHPPAVDAHLADLARFVSLGESTGALVAIVLFDPPMTLAPASLDLYRRFVDRAVGAGLPVWSLAVAFRPHGLSELSVSAVDCHPSVLANRLAAEVDLTRVNPEAIHPRLLEALRRPRLPTGRQPSPPPSGPITRSIRAAKSSTSVNALERSRAPRAISSRSVGELVSRRV